MKRAAAVSELVADLLHRQGLEGKVEEYRSWLVWDEAVGPQIAAHARPVRIREGVLEVRVDQAVWMQQLQLLKPKILAKVNDRLGQTVLRDIFWRRGRIEPVISAEAEKSIPWRSAHLSREEESFIDNTVAGMSDPELRQGLREILVRQRLLEKAKREAKN